MWKKLYNILNAKKQLRQFLYKAVKNVKLCVLVSIKLDAWNRIAKNNAHD